MFDPDSLVPSPGVQPIDTAALLRRCMGNVKVVGMILDRFERQAGEDFTAIADRMRTAHHHEASQLAHGLKGAAAMMAATGLANALAGIEAAALSASETQADSLLQNTKAELDACLAYLPTARAMIGCPAPSGSGPRVV